MGNDGGTIVRRADLVRVKEEGKAGVDPAVLAKVLATTCALSYKTLSPPVVSDSLGRLYNKDSVVKFLLRRNELPKNREDRVASHIRGLKDVRELKLTPNPSFQRDATASTATEEEQPAPFVCPLTQREMNGKHRFVYLQPCGCVMSESGLRAVVAEQINEQEQKATCPVCGTAFSTSTFAKREVVPGGDIILLNGTDEEVAAMRETMEKKRDVELARKKELKASAADAEKDGESDEKKAKKREEKRKRKEEAIRLLDLEEKRARRESGGVQALPTRADIVAAEAKGRAAVGKEMSAAMRSIYGLDKPKQTGETWMTRGTFNRFA